ncbi:hypothetical protein GIB67_014087 [Kingdonia uniflora]|uniref:Transposase MuDR plant domain-containing protein n=1 Tax=Kingdonia uniflora TaxID=39325 RepID=A0A7J7KXH7_9MAGN|nr:hypothetical protein GIB67_014087 [Kingdonia uniflora]
MVSPRPHQPQYFFDEEHNCDDPEAIYGTHCPSYQLHPSDNSDSSDSGMNSSEKDERRPEEEDDYSENYNNPMILNVLETWVEAGNYGHSHDNYVSGKEFIISRSSNGSLSWPKFLNFTEYIMGTIPKGFMIQFEQNHMEEEVDPNSKNDLNNLEPEDGYYSTHSSQDGDGIPTIVDLAKHEEFKQYTRIFIRTWSIMNKFTYMERKNDSYRLRFKCTDENCTWMIYARRSPDGHTMTVKGSSVLEHTCEGNSNEKNQLANALWVAKYCEDGLRNCKQSRPLDVKTTIRRIFGIDLSYWTSWNGWTICMERIVALMMKDNLRCML